MTMNCCVFNINIHRPESQLCGIEPFFSSAKILGGFIYMPNLFAVYLPENLDYPLKMDIQSRCISMDKYY